MSERAVLFFSGGKESVLALERVRRSGSPTVTHLVLTYCEATGRVPIHETPLDLHEAQAEALGLPLLAVKLPPAAPNAVYEERLGEALRGLGAEAAVAGDVFLEEVRAFRAAFCRRLGLAPHFPLWGADPLGLAREFLAAGWRARVVSVDTTQLDGAFCGRDYDERFLAELPAGVDPLGEGGAFHTFVSGGPLFERAILLPAIPVRREGRFAVLAWPQP